MPPKGNLETAGPVVGDGIAPHPPGMALASSTGAGVATDQRPPIGALVTLGTVQGRVVRHLEEGFAVEFTRLQHPDFLEDNVTGG